MYARGRADQLRVLRRCSELIHISLVGNQKAIDVTKFIQLPFDDEITTTAEQEIKDLEAWYSNVTDKLNRRGQ